MKILKYILISMRPRQWFKNLFIFAGLVFSLHLMDLHYLKTTILGFILFSVLSGCVYIINDLADYKKDKNHDDKKNRPIASQKLSRINALAAVFILLPVTIFAGFMINEKFGIIQVVYLLMQLFYSFAGKNIVILDVMLISFGFVLRAIAGSFVIEIGISHWLLICTLLLSLFLALCKRRHELLNPAFIHENTGLQEINKGKREHKTRNVLFSYDADFIDQMISVVTASTLMAYILYTISPDVVLKFRTNNLLFTVPMVLFGIFRYLYIVYVENKGSSPEKAILSDAHMIVNLILWFAVVVFVLYFRDGISFF